MCNWFKNKSPTHTFAVDCETWHCKWAAPCYFNGALPTGSLRWGYCLQWHLACEGLYKVSLCTSHDDVIKWRHFSRYWPFVRGIHRSLADSPHKGQCRGALIFSLNGWANNRDARDFRRHRAHYHVTVIYRNCTIAICQPGARPTNGISIEFEIRSKFGAL